MIKQNIAEIATMLSATSGIAFKSLFIGISLEDLMLYWVFPITAGAAVHMFRRLSDKLFFKNKEQKQKEEEKNE
jgi:Na+/citrate or Na+/malate symporter